MSKSKSSDDRRTDLINRIIKHVLFAGSLSFPYDRNEYLAGKAFHLARAVDLTDHLKDELKSDSSVRAILDKAFKRSKVFVVLYDSARCFSDGKPKSLDLLINILMDNKPSSSDFMSDVIKNFEAGQSEKRNKKRNKKSSKVYRSSSDDDDCCEKSIGGAVSNAMSREERAAARQKEIDNYPNNIEVDRRNAEMREAIIASGGVPHNPDHRGGGIYGDPFDAT